MVRDGAAGSVVGAGTDIVSPPIGRDSDEDEDDDEDEEDDDEEDDEEDDDEEAGGISPTVSALKDVLLPDPDALLAFLRGPSVVSGVRTREVSVTLTSGPSAPVPSPFCVPFCLSLLSSESDTELGPGIPPGLGLAQGLEPGLGPGREMGTGMGKQSKQTSLEHGSHSQRSPLWWCLTHLSQWKPSS